MTKESDEGGSESESDLYPNAEFPIQTTLNLVDCLHDKATAIAVSAHETREETVPTPRNLLAAYTRFERHIEIFMKVTNQSRARMEGDAEMLAEIQLLRKECAHQLDAVGKVLGCKDGFLAPEYQSLNEDQCQECLKEAADLAEGLARSFRSIGRKFGSDGTSETPTAR